MFYGTKNCSTLANNGTRNKFGVYYLVWSTIFTLYSASWKVNYLGLIKNDCDIAINHSYSSEGLHKV